MLSAGEAVADGYMAEVWWWRRWTWRHQLEDRHGVRSGWREEVSPVWKPTVDLGQGSTECGLEPACRRTRGGGLVVAPVGTA